MGRDPPGRSILFMMGQRGQDGNRNLALPGSTVPAARAVLSSKFLSNRENNRELSRIPRMTRRI
jgi:hypothetical protein